MLVGTGGAPAFPRTLPSAAQEALNKGIIAGKCRLSAGDAVLRGGRKLAPAAPRDLHEPRIAESKSRGGIAARLPGSAPISQPPPMRRTRRR